MRGSAEHAAGLSERERDVLRLLLVGHDAKSTACALNLSVHAVNERLRSARRKLGVSSSRAAARLLAQHEGSDPKFRGDERLGIAPNVRVVAAGALPAHRAAEPRPPWMGGLTGAVMIAIAILGGAALIGRSQVNAARQSPAPPHVVATYPVQGARVPPGPSRLSVTFDRPMHPGSYSFVQVDAASYPDCGDNRPVQSADGRTFTMRCKLLPDRRYEIWFNSAPYMNFKSPEGVPATPFQLKFGTGHR